MSGSLIPNAKQQYFDANGNPLAGGFVYYYIPGTTTFKNTYQDAGLTILNTNPIILDSAGEAIIYGSGSYRQIVTDVNGNLIWDQTTVSPITLTDVGSVYSASNGSSLIGYNEGGTGSVTRTVQSKLQESVSVKDFGAVGDGVTDDTAAIQAAANYVDSNDRSLYLPSGQYRITSTITFQKPPQIVGEKYSPPVVGNDTAGNPYTLKGSVILSEVSSGYAIIINPAANSIYIRGVYLADFHVLAKSGGSTGYGIAISNCGWQGYVRNLTIEGFAGQGLALNQVQDSLFENLEILRCGTDNVYPALYIYGASNFLTFIRPRLEFNAWHLYVNENCFAIEFHASHMEQSDAPSLPLSALNVIPRYPSIRVNNSTQIKFIGGVFNSATLASTIAKYSITAAQCPYYIQITTSTDVSFINSTIGAGYDRGKLISFSADGFISNCAFFKACIEDYPILLAGNVLFTNNNVDLTDIGTSTAFCGISASAATIAGNILTSLNSSGLTKTSGFIFAGNGSGNARLGENQIAVIKYNTVCDTTQVQISQNTNGYTVGAFAGSVDLSKFEPNKILSVNAVGTLTGLTNAIKEQTITFFNTAAGNYTITTGGAIYCKGGVNAVVPQAGFITFKFSPFTGVFTEYSRSF